MKDAVRVSGLWKQIDKAGKTYLSGKLSAISRILVMPNDHKKAGDDKSPDYHLYFLPSEETPARKQPEGDL